MDRRICIVLALSACGRIGFDGEGAPGIDAIRAGDATMSTVDAPALLAPIACTPERTTIAATDGLEIVVEPTATPMVAWRTSAGAVNAGILGAGGGLAMVSTVFAGGVERVVSAYPVATGHVIAIERTNVEEIYAINASLQSPQLRGSGVAGSGRGSLTGFGGYVFWGHVASGTTRSLLFERLDDMGNPTTQSNRTTGADVRDLVVGGATDSHAHLVWAEADDTCTSSELFGGVAPLVDIGTKQMCRSPRNASGIGDSLVTAYATPSGALRMYALSGDYEHDFELSPSANNPTLADDGNVVWATWFDDRVGGALVLAKITLTPTSATVNAHELTGVVPTAPSAVALVGDAMPARLLVLEAGSIAVVQPCL